MISRRTFLRLCGVTFASAALPSFPSNTASTPVKFSGRVLKAQTSIYGMPYHNATVVQSVQPDTVLSLTESVAGWFKAEQGYVQAHDVQPMLPYKRPEVFTAMPADGPFWAEVIAPVTVTRTWPLASAPLIERPGYGAVMYIVDVQVDDAGVVWYRDDAHGTGSAWVQALHLRRLDPDIDLAPLAPGAADKRLRIDTARCRLTAAIGDETVLVAPISPDAEAVIEAARFGVAARLPTLALLDKPGLPWVVLAVAPNGGEGVVLHGAYWHNQFGEPYDDGGIALAPAVARWLYRWVEVGRTHVQIVG